jgi:uncharacterized repeat protein (TIGR01451 family)
MSGSTTTQHGTPGDDDLSALVGTTTYDAAVIEFDFIPANDFISFQYVFGSEEYLEYVGTQFNDVFAFFVNGVNYALLPNGDVVSINTVNLQQNSEYYIDNDPRINPEAAYDTEMDGFTTVLTFLAPVASGEVNHLRIAVADVQDRWYDSAVLIKTGSLTSRKSDLSLEKTVDISKPTNLQTVAYTLTVSNAGPDAATGVQVRDTLPSTLTYAGHEGDGTYDPAKGLWVVPDIPVGETAELVIRATVTGAGAATNSAEIVASDNFDPDSVPDNGDTTEDDYATATVTPVVADLSLAKVADTDTANVGDTVLFSVMVANNGPDDATNVSVQESMPAGITVLSATGAGTFDTATGIWAVGTVPAYTTASLSLSCRIDAPGPHTNRAEVLTSDAFDPDSVPGNGSTTEDDDASATIATTVADLSLVLAVDEQRPSVGDTVHFTATVSNAGPHPATGISAAITLPAGLILEGASDPNYHNGLWNIGSMAVGASASVVLTATVASHLPQDAYAEIRTADQDDPDSVPGNGKTSEDDFDAVRIVPRYADLSIVAMVDTARPGQGDVVTLRITVRNDGPDGTGGVTVCNVLPNGLAYEEDSGAGAYDPDTDLWNIGTLAPGETVMLEIRARVVDGASMICTAEVATSSEYDPDSVPGNGKTSEDDYAYVLLTPQGQSDEDEEQKNPYNHFAVLMPVVMTTTAEANAVWGCLIDEMPDEMPEALAELVQAVSAHMANAVSYTNPIYVNSELCKALGLMRQIDDLLVCRCWQR